MREAAGGGGSQLDQGSASTGGESVLGEQVAYYRARAAEYDEWFERRGRYDRGPEANRVWRSEVRQLRTALDVFKPNGKVLELACGTGLWTEQLLRHADSVTAVDASPEMLEIARARIGSGRRLRFEEADIFSWRSKEPYDVVFFAFWLSHVPPERFEPFWNGLREWLRPGGRVFLIDSLYDETSTASDHVLEGPAGIRLTRRLNDGREFRIVKVFYDPLQLTQKLEELGWSFVARTTGRYFLYGWG